MRSPTTSSSPGLEPPCRHPVPRPGGRQLARLCRPLLLLCLLAPLAMPASGQFSQYTPAGDFEEDFEATRELLETAMAESRWQWGPLLVDPWIGLRELTYDDNVGNRPRGNIVSDYLLKVGAGVRAYAPVKEQMIFAAHLLPEYVYWQDLDNRRQVDGRYGAGLFGNLGPVDLELSLQHVEDTKFFSREFEDRVDTEEDFFKLDLALELAQGWSVFAAGAFNTYSFDDQEEGVDAPVSLLNRDETLSRFGVRFKPSDRWRFGLGAEYSLVDFDRDPRRSNSGLSPLVQVDLEGGRLLFSGRVVFRDLESDGSESLFPAFDDLSGRFRAAWQVNGPVQLELLGYRSLVYSFQDVFAYFVDEATAVGLISSLGSRAGLRLRYEDGSNEYAPFNPNRAPRSDDFESFSAELQLQLGPLTLVINASETSYDSNIDQFDRDVTTVSSGIVLGRRKQSPWG